MKNHVNLADKIMYDLGLDVNTFIPLSFKMKPNVGDICVTMMGTKGIIVEIQQMRNMDGNMSVGGIIFWFNDEKPSQRVSMHAFRDLDYIKVCP